MVYPKAIIADDEEFLRTHLKVQLTQIWPELSIVGEASNGLDAVKIIRTHQPDIAFLDIRMPGMTGFEVAKKTAGICRVVFVTAFNQYAVEAFENEAIDYLLKPVTHERLIKTVLRLKKRLSEGVKESERIKNILTHIINGLPQTPERKYLGFIRTQKRECIELIPVDEVLYFKSSDKYTAVYTKDGETLIRKPIKDLIAELDPEKFWRIHRGTIVNVSSVLNVSRSITGRYVVKLKKTGTLLTVSRTHSHLFRQM